METLKFVTGNINKGYEIQEKFDKENIAVEIITMDFDEPEVNDIEYVSRSKVIQAYEVLKTPCFVIDSGFNILDYPGNPGYPGAYVRRSGISTNIDMLLETMKNVKDRRAQFFDCLTFYDGNLFYVFYGRDEGIITKEKRGTKSKKMRSDLWYVFQPNGFNKTLAEMSDLELENRKNGHLSAKGQFINWYKNTYLASNKLERKVKDIK